MHFLIAGAGIGGLTAALMLHEQGIECTIFEQAREIRELGVGLNLLPHAVKALAQLGLLEEFDASAIRTDLLIMANRFGQEIWREPRGADAGYDVPQYSFHRGRLQTILLAAVRERLGDVVRIGHKVVDFDADGDGVTALIETAGGIQKVRGDALLGADGIHSATRKRLFPDQGAPLWSGIFIWRGAAEWPAFLTGNSMTILGGSAEKMVVYPIAPGEAKGTRLTNWTINVRIGRAGDTPPAAQDWSHPGERDELLRRARRFQSPLVDVQGLVEASGEFWEHPMCDRDPLPYWSSGRVTLLGDAAHPMYPMGSNGAGQAILDAQCLARVLGKADSVERAFKDYEEERLPVTSEVVRRNRSGGPELVIDRVEELAPDGFDDIDAVLSHAERERIASDYATKAGYSRGSVNDR